MKTLKYLLIGLSAIFAVIGFLAFALIELDKYDTTHAPEDFYKIRLEGISRDTLPSFKILRNEYVEGSRVSVIIQLDGTDYAKVLKAVQANDKRFKINPKISFWDITDDLIKKEHIDINKVKIRYEGVYGKKFGWDSEHIGFLPPNIVIYEEDLNN
jgi:hypothetical protein